MDFFRILNNALTIIVWLLLVGLVYAVYPYLEKLLHLIQVMHNFAK